MENYKMDGVEKAPFFPSQRMVLVLMAFLGNIFVYTVRVNFSVAIICMVRSDVANVSGILGNGSDAIDSSTNVTVCGDDTSSTGIAASDSGEFDWSKSIRSELLAMYFYGYIFTQIPGGWLASKYGGRRVWGVCQFVSAVCTLITPVCARTNVYLLYAARFILGFAAGVTFPAQQALLGQWAPKYERSKMGSFAFAGPLVGAILTFSISGLLCEYGFDNGWGSIFYLAGIGNMLWVIGWYLLTADRPDKHKFISEKEKLYIETSIGEGLIKKVTKVPWLAMFTSGPLWAAITAHFCNNYVNYTLLTSLPTFMKESLNFNIKQNGALSALPYLSQCTFSFVAGYVADTVRERGWMSTKSVRKFFQVSSSIGTAVCIAIVGVMTCEQRYIAVFMLCMCTFFMSFNRAGYLVNHLDLAPSYAGVLYGITNTAATVPGMIAPIIAGALTPNKTAEEWRTVFYVCAAVAAAGAVIYLVLADGELQPWGVPLESKQEMEIMSGQEVPEKTQTAGAGEDGDTRKNEGNESTVATFSTS